jgi:hypothetical protein
MNTQFNTINDDSRLTLVEMRLSRQPEATRVEDQSGVLQADGKRYLNLTSDNRKMYIAVFRDPTDPFGSERTRVFSQNTDSSGGNAVWKKGNPALIQKFVGKIVPAEIVTRDVMPYDVGSNTGITSYTCVILKNENINSVFASQSHPIIGSPQADGYAGVSVQSALQSAQELLQNVGNDTVNTETGEVMEDEEDNEDTSEEEEAVDVSELIGDEEES